MARKLISLTLTLALCLIASPTLGAPRGGRSGGGRPPGGNWEPKGESNFGRQQSSFGGSADRQSSPFGNQGQSRGEFGREQGAGGNRNPSSAGDRNFDSGAAAARGKNPQSTGGEGAAAGAAASQRNNPSASGGQGAAAGAAAANRNQPQASGAQGAAAGAAASNRNQPSATGAQGAAAGAAAANRNQPQYSGAEGAAAGAAAANRNQPQYSGAEGAAAGAAAANRNQPQYSGAEGAAAGAAAANRNQPQYSGAAGAAAGYDAVRNSFNHPTVYGEGWYGDHPNAWAPTGVAAGALWTAPTWNTAAAQCGYGDTLPVSFNYGENVTCQNGMVTVNGQPAGTAEQFSQQAADLAEQGASAEGSADGPWLPLGVYGLVRNEQQHPQLILQLAINKAGILRGNYTDSVTDQVQSIQGAVDKNTKRAAWFVGETRNAFMEAGLANLLEGEAPTLIHRGGTTQHWTLVRLQKPAN